MNKVFLNGYLAADPTQRISSTGMEISNILVAVNDVKNFSESYLIPCTSFGTQAKYINSNLKKGSFVAIDGRLTRRSYVNQNGQTIYTMDVYIDNIKNFGSRRNQSESESTSYTKPMNEPVNSFETSSIHANLDDVFNTNTISNPTNSTSFNSSNNEDDDDIDWDDELN